MPRTYRLLSDAEKFGLHAQKVEERFNEVFALHLVAFIALTHIIFFVLLLTCKPTTPIMKSRGPSAPKSYLFLLSIVLAGTYVGRLLLMALSSRHKIVQSALYQSIEEDLENNVAVIETLSVRKAVEIKPYSDEGTGFFLALSDGRILCIIGPDLDPYAHDAAPPPDPDSDGAMDRRTEFPRAHIEYTYTPSSAVRLGLRGYGKPCRPQSRVLSHRDTYPPDGTHGPKSDCFYEGPLEDVLRRFGYTERPLPRS